MGLNESKMRVSEPTKPEPAFTKSQIGHLIDPRSPSATIDRTPIQVNEVKAVALKSECPVSFTDPRSPSVGVQRTPVREIMRAKVDSLARRLGILFHSEAGGEFTKPPQKGVCDAVEEETLGGEEQTATEPLLTPRPPRTCSSLAEHANLLATPVLERPHVSGDSSPYVILEQPQAEVELETAADVSLEEAEEAKESPLHKRLSLSLITCHDGAPSSQIFAEVHCDITSSPVSAAGVEPIKSGVDHCYALPLITVQPESDLQPPVVEPSSCPAEVLSAEPQHTKVHTTSSSEESQKPVKENPPTTIRCPTVDPRSPSQVVFKPQWLGKDFGASALRVRGVQGNSGKRTSSPLAVCVTNRNASNENKSQSGKLKQKGAQGRSPLQLLREGNTLRDQRSQVKLKASTPDRTRAAQMDRRVLAVVLDKENR